MLVVSQSDLSSAELAILGNNVRPTRAPNRCTPNQRANQRILAAANRSDASHQRRTVHHRSRRVGARSKPRSS
jgi:hypothetical protein